MLLWEKSEFLRASELTETRAFVRSFVKEIEVKPGRAAIVYSIPTLDQKQHLELTRDIAERFNQIYGDMLTVPRPLIGHTGAGARIMGLDDPTVKMSKSNPRADHAVSLLDPADVVRRKIRRAKTDSANAVDVARPEAGIANLVEIYRSATGASVEEAGASLDGIGYGEVKDRVADAVIDVLSRSKGGTPTSRATPKP